MLTRNRYVIFLFLDLIILFLDITFINYGLDSLIVEDDGDGISPDDMIQIGKNKI